MTVSRAAVDVDDQAALALLWLDGAIDLKLDTSSVIAQSFAPSSAPRVDNGVVRSVPVNLPRCVRGHGYMWAMAMTFTTALSAATRSRMCPRCAGRGCSTIARARHRPSSTSTVCIRTALRGNLCIARCGGGRGGSTGTRTGWRASFDAVLPPRRNPTQARKRIWRWSSATVSRGAQCHQSALCRRPYDHIRRAVRVNSVGLDSHVVRCCWPGCMEHISQSL